MFKNSMYLKIWYLPSKRLKFKTTEIKMLVNYEVLVAKKLIKSIYNIHFRVKKMKIFPNRQFLKNSFKYKLNISLCQSKRIKNNLIDYRTDLWLTSKHSNPMQISKYWLPYNSTRNFIHNYKIKIRIGIKMMRIPDSKISPIKIPIINSNRNMRRLEIGLFLQNRSSST